MNVAFTIVAKNYVGLAQILKESIIKHNPSVHFYIFIADEIEDVRKLGDDVLLAKKHLAISEAIWRDMSFKYSLTEFCTAIKPYCFEFLFKKYEADNVIYFDPDIYVFNSLSSIYKKLESSSIILVPHICFPNLLDDSDRSFLQSGIYNLGFLALSNNEISGQLIEWWKSKLKNNCFDEVLDYTFTDQKWMNFIPALFSSKDVYICRDLGLNIAPWNFYEREIVFDGEIPSKVKPRNCNGEECDIVFIHYSGFDYKSLLTGQNKRTRTAAYEMNYEDISKCLAFYTSVLNENKELILKCFSMSYTYGCFSNGVPIEKFHRRLYRGLSSYETIDFPYDVSANSLYAKMLKKKMFDSNNYSTTTLQNNSVNKKLRYFNCCMRLLYHIIGYKRYIAILRLMKHFSRFESQIFIIDNKYSTLNIGILNKRKK